MLTLGVLALLQIRHATRAQIRAVLPPSLKVVDKPDPSGEKRLLRIEALAKSLSNPTVNAGFGASATAESKRRAVEAARPILAEVERELTGTLCRPSRPDPMDSFPRAASLKFLSKTLALAANEAAGREDQAACAGYILLGLRLGDRLMSAGGGLIDLFVTEAIEAIGDRAAFDADARGDLGNEDRRRVLALLRPLAGPTPELGTALRHEFTSEWLPLLMDPVYGSEVVFGTSKGFAHRRFASFHEAQSDSGGELRSDRDGAAHGNGLRCGHPRRGTALLGADRIGLAPCRCGGRGNARCGRR